MMKSSNVLRFLCKMEPRGYYVRKFALYILVALTSLYFLYFLQMNLKQSPKLPVIFTANVKYGEYNINSMVEKEVKENETSDVKVVEIDGRGVGNLSLEELGGNVKEKERTEKEKGEKEEEQEKEREKEKQKDLLSPKATPSRNTSDDVPSKQHPSTPSQPPVIAPLHPSIPSPRQAVIQQSAVPQLLPTLQPVPRETQVPDDATPASRTQDRTTASNGSRSSEASKGIEEAASPAISHLPAQRTQPPATYQPSSPSTTPSASPPGPPLHPSSRPAAVVLTGREGVSATTSDPSVAPRPFPVTGAPAPRPSRQEATHTPAKYLSIPTPTAYAPRDMSEGNERKDKNEKCNTTCVPSDRTNVPRDVNQGKCDTTCSPEVAGNKTNKERNCNTTCKDVNKEAEVKCNTACVPVDENKRECNSTCVPKDVNEDGERKAECHNPCDPPEEDKDECSKPRVTIFMAGRLGNQLCEYALLKVLEIEFGAQVYLQPNMYYKLHKPFPNISIKMKKYNCTSTKTKFYEFKTLYNVLKALNAKYKKALDHPAAITGYPCNVNRFWKYRDLWKREFTFTKAIQEKNRKRMNETLKIWREKQGSATTEGDNRSGSPVVIGVHVRRTDYIAHIARRTGGGSIPGLNYYNKAFDYYRKRFGRVAFVVSSDDRAWCRMVLQRLHKDVVVSPVGTYEEDMALLASTSHMVMSVGTFGMWSGLLAEGTMTYPKKVGKKSEHKITKYLNMARSPDLIPIS